MERYPSYAANLNKRVVGGYIKIESICVKKKKKTISYMCMCINIYSCVNEYIHLYIYTHTRENKRVRNLA